MQQQQYAPYFPQQVPPAVSKPLYLPNTDQDCKLHISQLHETITEEILWKEFRQFGTISSIRVLRDKETQRSKRSAKITFSTPEQAKEALQKMNLTYLIKGDIVQNQKRIIVSKDIQFDKLQQLKKANLYIKNIPNNTDPKTLYNFLTQYGDIQSMSVIEKKDGTGYGFVLFEKKESNDKLLGETDNGSAKFGDSVLTFEGYVNPSERESKTTNNLYIRDFSTVEFTEDQLKDQAFLDKQIQEQQAVLEKLLSAYGNILSLIVQVDQTKRKLYAFACYQNSEDAEKVFNDFNSDKFKTDFPQLYINLNSKKSASKSSASEDRCLFLKNLKCFEDETEKAEFERRTREVLESYGKISSIKIEKGKKPKDKQNLADSNFAIVFYATEQSAKTFLHNYLDSKDASGLFLKDSAHGCVTICMPAHERKRMLRQKVQNTRNLINFQQQAQQYPQMMQGKPFYPQQQVMGPMKPGAGRMPPHQRQPNVRGPQQGFQQRQARPGPNNNGPRPVQQQPRPVQQQQQPKPVQQQQQQEAAKQPEQPAKQPTQTVTLEDIKSNFDKFNTLESAKQGQILGNLLYPKVQSVLVAAGESDVLAAKITGMLIDFSVFELTDIIDFLETPDELKERVEEAIELIKQQQ